MAEITTIAARRPFHRRRKTCPFSGDKAPKIDYKDVRLLEPLRVRARQDRAEPHHGRVGQEAARAGQRHQARALPRAAALRDQVTGRRARRPAPSFVERLGRDAASAASSLTAAAGQLQDMPIGFLIGLGGGLASALLFYSAARGSPLFGTLLLRAHAAALAAGGARLGLAAGGRRCRGGRRWSWALPSACRSRPGISWRWACPWR